MKIVPISNIVDFVIVDEEDYNLICNTSIYYRNKKDKYPCVWRDGKTVPIHQIITNAKLVDHINGNRLDNRKENLRVVTKQQIKI